MNAFDHEQIDRYLSGDLNGEELRDFEQRLLEDANLRKALGTQRELQDTLHRELFPDQRQQAFMQTLASHRGSVADQTQKRREQIPRYVIAATAMAAMIAGLLFFSPWQKDLYHQYSSVEMVSPAERGEHNEGRLLKAVELFNDKEFASAIPLLGEALTGDSTNAYARYYRGIALMETSQLPEARTDLQKVFDGNSLFKYDAAFYMALTYLKEDDFNNSRVWLQKIPEDAANYEKAQKLLNDL
ncbi:hypothetical protein [uncultured Chitinophaga sp.]|uniref:tetratricopeptide repeat protein n=1 Tax=uncultured Chitinophaga sp. TaxID=339340 RepID=UPI0026011EC5|nr:hypothetical protein [uncultured Chitinophaga sp.]